MTYLVKGDSLHIVLTHAPMTLEQNVKTACLLQELDAWEVQRMCEYL